MELKYRLGVDPNCTDVLKVYNVEHNMSKKYNKETKFGTTQIRLHSHIAFRLYVDPGKTMARFAGFSATKRKKVDKYLF